MQSEMGTWQAGSAPLAKSNSDGSREQVLGSPFPQMFCLPTHPEIQAPTKQAVAEGITATKFSH